MHDTFKNNNISNIYTQVIQIINYYKNYFNIFKTILEK
jgi:hypothetical protein